MRLVCAAGAHIRCPSSRRPSGQQPASLARVRRPERAQQRRCRRRRRTREQRGVGDPGHHAGDVLVDRAGQAPHRWLYLFSRAFLHFSPTYAYFLQPPPPNFSPTFPILRGSERVLYSAHMYAFRAIETFLPTGPPGPPAPPPGPPPAGRTTHEWNMSGSCI